MVFSIGLTIRAASRRCCGSDLRLSGTFRPMRTRLEKRSTGIWVGTTTTDFTLIRGFPGTSKTYYECTRSVLNWLAVGHLRARVMRKPCGKRERTGSAADGSLSKHQNRD